MNPNPQSPTTPTTRQIDAEVAEKVMKWPFPEDPEAYTATNETWGFKSKNGGVQKGEAYYCKYAPEGRKYTRQYKFFRPSEDISAAMEVVKRMKELEFTVQMTDISGTDKAEWLVEFTTQGNRGQISCHAEHESLATAICLAALKASGGRGE